MHPGRRLALCLAGVLAACSSEQEDSMQAPLDAAAEGVLIDATVDSPINDSPYDASTDSAADAVVEAAADADSAVDAPTEAATPTGIAIPATSGQVQPGFSVTSKGAGEKRLDALDIAQDVGTLTLEGAAHRGIAYQMHDWGQAGYVLYDVLSIAEDGSDLAVTYLYCQGSDLPYAYTESLVHPMDWENTTGTCEGSDAGISAAAQLPALSVATQPFDTGISIQGSDLQLGPTGGNVVLGGKQWKLVPFNTVDCSTNCPGGSWYEIHSLLAGDQEGCFVILYLFPATPDFVQLSYTMCLPSLERPTATYQAGWTGTLQGKPQPMMWRPSPPLPAPDSEWHFAP